MFVSQDKFNAVVSERDQALANVTTLTEEVQSLSSQNESLTEKLENANQTVASLQASATEKDNTIATLTQKVATLTELPGAKSATISSETESPDSGIDDDDKEQEKLSKMSITERIAYLRK